MSMPTLGPRIAALAVGGLTVGLAAADLAFLDFFGPFVVIPLALLPLGMVGALLIGRFPRNVVGWLLGLAGILFQLTFTLGAYAWTALVRDPGRLPAGDVANAFANVCFAPALGSAILMLLFFPSGRGLGGRWMWVERALVTVIVIGSIAALLKDAPIQISAPLTGASPDGAGRVANPLAVTGPAGAVIEGLSHLVDSTTIPIALMGPLSLIVRYRRSAAVERQQIKWVAYSGGLAVTLVVSSNFTSGDLSNWLWGLGVAGMGLLPVAIAMAILRYRLYDIDVLIRRTLIYAALSAVLIAAYVAGVALFQALLAPFTAGSSVAVAISTLGVVALFQPLRSRIQQAVDRRFYRSKYDAERTLDAFAARLREQIDLGALEQELLAVVDETLQPARAGVWLRGRPA